MPNARLISLVASVVAISTIGCDGSSEAAPMSEATHVEPAVSAGRSDDSSGAGSTASPGASGAGGGVAAGMGGAMAGGAGAAGPSISDAGSDTPVPRPGSGAMVTDSGEWSTLVQGAWEMPAGQEGYRCVRLTMTEDVYIKEFQPIAPPGTHHTLLSINETPKGADGISNCSAGDNGLVMLLGSGAGENYSAGPLPDGVAYKVGKGTQLNLNLHLFNLRESSLSGVSGIKVRTTTADAVSNFAETILAGPLTFSIPPGRSTVEGQCTIKSDTTVFAVAPHMHQLGVYLKAVLKRSAGGTETLFDGAYDFDDQRQTATGRLALTAGDKVQVECTYENTTTKNIGFGQSSLDEMCFIGLYRYPIAGESSICAF